MAPVQHDNLWAAAHRARVQTCYLPGLCLLWCCLVSCQGDSQVSWSVGDSVRPRVCVPTKGFAGPEMSSCGLDRVHLSALALLPLLSWRALHCPTGRISGLPLEHKKHSVAFPAISAAAGAAALLQGLPRLLGWKEPPAKWTCDGPYLVQTGMSARPVKPCKRAVYSVR